jgi:hypothetical protein
MTWKDKIKPQLNNYFEIVEIYDDGTNGSNEVARIKLTDGTEIVTKVMLGVKKYHQRRKALTEVAMYLLDAGLGGDRVVPDLYAELFELTPVYADIWGQHNIEGHFRVCQVVREYAPAQPGDEWRGEVYKELGNLKKADQRCREIIENHPDAERISVLDFLTINQDRSARNWVTDHGQCFFAIDNGMAWYHSYPESDEWRDGCVIDDVILQKDPWKFISGIFTTSYAGRQLSRDLHQRLHGFDETKFLQGIEQGALDLGFPSGLSQDWRFEGVLRRLRWMVKSGRQPTEKEYRSWHKKSKLMTPPEIIVTGGKLIWNIEMDYDFARL